MATAPQTLFVLFTPGVPRHPLRNGRGASTAPTRRLQRQLGDPRGLRDKEGAGDSRDPRTSPLPPARPRGMARAHVGGGSGVPGSFVMPRDEVRRGGWNQGVRPHPAWPDLPGPSGDLRPAPRRRPPVPTCGPGCAARSGRCAGSLAAAVRSGRGAAPGSGRAALPAPRLLGSSARRCSPATSPLARSSEGGRRDTGKRQGGGARDGGREGGSARGRGAGRCSGSPPSPGRGAARRPAPRPRSPHRPGPRRALPKRPLPRSYPAGSFSRFLRSPLLSLPSPPLPRSLSIPPSSSPLSFSFSLLLLLSLLSPSLCQPTPTRLACSPLPLLLPFPPSFSFCQLASSLPWPGVVSPPDLVSVSHSFSTRISLLAFLFPALQSASVGLSFLILSLAPPPRRSQGPLGGGGGGWAPAPCLLSPQGSLPLPVRRGAPLLT